MEKGSKKRENQGLSSGRCIGTRVSRIDTSLKHRGTQTNLWTDAKCVQLTQLFPDQQRHCFKPAHPAAEMVAQAKCPPFSDLGSNVSRNTGGCTCPPTPPPLSNLVPSSKPANPDEKHQSCLGTSHKSRVWLCMIRTKRGSRARKATGTGGRGSIDRGPCCCNGSISVPSVVRRGFV